jgi:hypothetical protein
MTVEQRIPEKWLMVYAKAIEDVLQRAVHQALLVHKRVDNPIATWQEERVVILPPEDIPVNDALAHARPGNQSESRQT